MFATATPVNGEPTLRELIGNGAIEAIEARGYCGFADELARWTDEHTPEVGDLDDEHVDRLMAEADADRSGHPVYRVTSPGFPVTFESARDGYVAIRQARQRWARGGTSFRAEQVTLARRAA